LRNYQRDRTEKKITVCDRASFSRVHSLLITTKDTFHHGQHLTTASDLLAQSRSPLDIGLPSSSKLFGKSTSQNPLKIPAFTSQSSSAPDIEALSPTQFSAFSSGYFTNRAGWDDNFNSGGYQGVKTVAMNPGDTFGVALLSHSNSTKKLLTGSRMKSGFLISLDQHAMCN